MEIQTSFSIKTARLLVLSLTIPFFFFFLNLNLNALSHTKNNSSGFQTQVGFVNISSSEGLLSVNKRSGDGNEKQKEEEEDMDTDPKEMNWTHTGTHFMKPDNISSFSFNLTLEVNLNIKSQTADEREEEDCDERMSVTHLGNSDNVSGFNRSLVCKRLPIININNESVEVLDTTYIKDNLSYYKLSPREQNEPLTTSVKAGISDIESTSRMCDFTKGRWVYDDRLPLYNNDSCPFIDEGFDCEGNGRSDKDYMKWRWQLEDCKIPRFNATQMLEIIRGKRLVFVGDSINRNQWESMLCLLMGAIKDPKRVYETHRRKITKEKGNYAFKFVDYKCTIEYYVTHFLVHESKARLGKKRVPTLRIDTMDRGSSRWKGADILLFNTAHWWTHSKTKSGINYYQEGDQVHPHLDAAVAFRRALTTWASWVDRYTDPHKTHVFFRTSSPSHFSGGLWNSGGRCKEAIQPLGNLSVIKYPEKNAILEEVLGKMKTPVTVLNITRISEYRIDGHPSLYGRKKLISKPSYNLQDCSHWCLPGVPDNWNELMYYNLYFKTKGLL